MTSEKPMPSHHGPAGQAGGSYPNETLRLLLERAGFAAFQPFAAEWGDELGEED